jgi:hypothetical protein
MDDLMLRRKWTLRAHGQQVVFVKRAHEHATHVLMKALLWALYLPTYPDIVVEIAIGDRYKPDLVALEPGGSPRFWGEAGQVSVAKIRSLTRRYRATHFALAKWDIRLAPLMDTVATALARARRTAPFDLICFPADSAARFINEQGEIHLTHTDIEWQRLQ